MCLLEFFWHRFPLIFMNLFADFCSIICRFLFHLYVVRLIYFTFYSSLFARFVVFSFGNVIINLCLLHLFVNSESLIYLSSLHSFADRFVCLNDLALGASQSVKLLIASK